MVAVICEFNPFHNGHKYLLGRAAALTGEPVLAIMSGSFTQRGEAAVCSKFDRAAAALRNGADLVVELPTVYAVASAERFARGGVEIAKAFGARFLAFGCETDDLEALVSAARAAGDSEVNALIAERMKSGDYYPKAAEYAVRAVCGDKAAEAVASPNNILAVEYLRALRDSGIAPLAIKRVGAAHDSAEERGGFMSASALREMLRAGKSIEDYAPETPEEITLPSLLERALLFRLRSMTAESFKALPEVGEGLENRIVSAVKSGSSVEEILSALKTKRYTHARLRRILACAALDITAELQEQKASYCRVLGFNEKGASLLKDCRFEVVTSVAKALRGGSVNSCFIQTDILGTDLAALAYKKIKPCGEDFTRGIVKSMDN